VRELHSLPNLLPEAYRARLGARLLRGIPSPTHLSPLLGVLSKSLVAIPHSVWPIILSFHHCICIRPCSLSLLILRKGLLVEEIESFEKWLHIFQSMTCQLLQSWIPDRDKFGSLSRSKDNCY
jgi:hypothetical protein